MTDAYEALGFENIITAMTGCAATQPTTDKIIATTLHHALGIYGKGENLKKVAFKMKNAKLKIRTPASHRSCQHESRSLHHSTTIYIK